MEAEKKNVLPIDRGWAWVITFASLGLFAFIAGSFKSQGVILVELQELFPENSPKSILWVFSLSSMLNKCLGPLNGLLLSKTSNRFISCLGFGLMTISLTSFAYTPKVEFMYLTYGVVYGIGSGMANLSVFTAYNGYFDKWKALSIGLTTAGSGIGTILIPLLLRMLFDNFSFSGAILLYAAVALQLMVLAALLRPISYYQSSVDWKSAKAQEETNNNATTDEQTVYSTKVAVDDEEDMRHRSLSVGARQHLLSPADQSEHLLPSADQSEQILMYLSAPHDINRLSVGVRNRHHHSKHSVNESVMELASMQDISGGSGLMFPTKEVDDCTMSDEESNNAGYVKKTTTGYNWRLAIQPKCLLLGVVMLFYTCGLGVAYQCIPPLGKSTGVSKKLIATLFTAAGCAEIPARIFNGWLADRGVMSAMNQLALCMTVTGICALICAIVSSTPGITVMIIGLSSTGTSVFSLVPIASSEMLGKSNVPTAMGLNFFYQGCGTIIATFCAGAIYEATQKWESVYYYISACCIAGGLLVFITSVTLRYKTKCASRIQKTQAGDTNLPKANGDT